jgi:hypothetical protein
MKTMQRDGIMRRPVSRVDGYRAAAESAPARWRRRTAAPAFHAGHVAEAFVQGVGGLVSGDGTRRARSWSAQGRTFALCRLIRIAIMTL